MTVRVTTLKGSANGAYYVDGPADYYLQSDEPRGLWHGDAATALGLSGEVAGEHFLALMAGMDPHQPDRHLGRGYDEKSFRGLDVTASAPKSVSVMFALGDADTRREVLAAHDASVTAQAGLNVTPTPATASAARSPSSMPRESSPPRSVSTPAAPSTHSCTLTSSSPTESCRPTVGGSRSMLG